MVSFLVGEAEADQRLDRALSTLVGVPRSQVRRWIDQGCVTVNAAPARPSQRVTLGDALEATPPAPTPASVEPEHIALAVLYEDADLIVVDKPAGMVVHPAPGHSSGTLVNALLHHCSDLAGIGGVLRPGVVHRLDRGTSGVMVVAKNDAAHLALADQFKRHTVERVYRAFVRGVPGVDEGRVERPIGRHRRDRKRMSVVTRHGRAARTAWRVEKRFPRSRVSLLEVRPETGRTHQIRVHLSACGLPILGDTVYGRGSRLLPFPGARLGRPALHAQVLGFDRPGEGSRIRLEAPFPADLADLVSGLDAREQGL